MRLEGWKAMERYRDALARELPAVLPTGWSVTTLPDPDYSAWTRFPARWLAYPRMIDWSRWDVVHVLDHSYAHVLHGRRGHARTVLTVHDLFAFDSLAQKPGIRGVVLRRINQWVLSGLRNADVCLCDSRATLEAVARHFPDVESRARHEMLGVDSHFFVPDRLASRHKGRQFLGLSNDTVVILHVGSCNPRKNLPGLLRAIHRLVKPYPSIHLAQIGGRFNPGDHAMINRLGLETRVTQHPHIAETEMPHVYAAADVVAVPSLFEGFGFPVLEAFAVGVPVVATRNTSLADFPDTMLQSAGQGSVDEIEHGLRSAFEDQDAALARAAMAREWAREKTWERVAVATARAYGAVV
jgi:glycosyltransferase involved in cell wall biosynthesis